MYVCCWTWWNLPALGYVAIRISSGLALKFWMFSQLLVKISVIETPWKSTSSGRENDSIWKTKRVFENPIFTDTTVWSRANWAFCLNILNEQIVNLWRKNILVIFCLQSATSAHFKEGWNDDSAHCDSYTDRLIRCTFTSINLCSAFRSSSW